VLPDDPHPTIWIRERSSKQARNPLAIRHHHLGLPGHRPERRPALATGAQRATIWTEDGDRILQRRRAVGCHQRSVR